MTESEIERGNSSKNWALGVNTISANRAFCASGAKRSTSTARSGRGDQIDLPGEISYPRIPVIAKQPSARKNSFAPLNSFGKTSNKIKIPELEALRHTDEVVIKQIKPKCLESKFKIFYKLYTLG